MRQTRAVVLPAAGAPVTVEQIRLREPEEGEVLLKIEACGVCHSDLFVAGLEKLPLAPVTLGTFSRSAGEGRKQPPAWA